MKSGRYIKIGKLYLPIDDTPPDTYRETYWVGPTKRAARIADCKADPLAGRPSNFRRIWNLLNKE